jgi:hypothetical protein
MLMSGVVKSHLSKSRLLRLDIMVWIWSGSSSVLENIPYFAKMKWISEIFSFTGDSTFKVYPSLFEITDITFPSA